MVRYVEQLQVGLTFFEPFLTIILFQINILGSFLTQILYTMFSVMTLESWKFHDYLG
jgi:hypothetical protein